MNRSPARRNGGGRPSKQIARAVEVLRQSELAVLEHHAEVGFRVQCDEIDARALSDVVRCALEEEFRVLDTAMEAAAGNLAKTELVSRKLAIQSQINNRRIARRFSE